MHRHVNGTREKRVKEEQEAAAAGHAVVREAHAATVWLLGGGPESQQASSVATDGKITDGPHPETKEVGRAGSTRTPDRC